MKKIILILLLINISSSIANKKVLFIGNSISEPWLEMRLKELVDSAGKEVLIQTLSFGGYSLSDHLKSETTQQWIDSLDWDFVVLQESPGVLASDSTTCDKYMLFAFDSLYQLIKKNNSCTEIVLFMPWAVDDVDTNTAPDPNYFTQQEAIKQNIIRYSNNYFCIIAPIGIVWMEVRVDKPWIPLYRDIVHANHTGHFLNASMFFTIIFNESSTHINNSSFVTEFIGDTLAEYLKNLSSNIVLDSLCRWNYFVNIPESEFSIKIQDSIVEFYSDKHSPALSHRWYFGDGDSSNESSTIHKYSSQGEYEVTHIVESDCYIADTSIKKINLILGMEDSENDNFIIFPQPASEYITFKDLLIGSFLLSIRDIQILNIYGDNLPVEIKHTFPLIIDISKIPNGVYLIRINDRVEKFVIFHH